MEQVTVFCAECGEELIWSKVDRNCTEDNIDDNVVIREITCEHCGTRYVEWVYLSEERDDMGPISDQGFGNCFDCGGTLVWGGDFMLSDFESDELDDDDDALVQSCTCAKCGAAVEIFHVPHNKKYLYPYWNQK